jgi:hypothetical protein
MVSTPEQRRHIEPKAEKVKAKSTPKSGSEPDPSPQAKGNGLDDPFSDPSKLVVSQDFERQAGVEKLLTAVPVRKPIKRDWIRVHADPAYRMSPAAVIELREERETYLVLPHLAIELSGEFRLSTLYLAINRQGVAFVWPVPLPDEGGRRNLWSESAHDAAELAMASWVRVVPNLSLNGYEVLTTTLPLADPEWPKLSFGEVLKLAFRGSVIDSLDHPVVRRLRGLE